MLFTGAVEMVPNASGLAALAGTVAFGGLRFTMLKVLVPSM